MAEMHIRSGAFQLITMLRAFFVHVRPLTLIAEGGQLKKEYDALCFLLVNKCLTLQMHPAEALSVHFMIMRTQRCGLIPADYWNNVFVRHIHFRGMILRQWMHENVRTMNAVEFRSFLPFIARSYNLDASGCVLYEGDHCPANAAYTGNPELVSSWYGVFSRPSTAMLYLGLYTPPQRNPRPGHRIFHALPRYDRPYTPEAWDTVLPYAPEFKENYLLVVAAYDQTGGEEGAQETAHYECVELEG